MKLNITQGFFHYFQRHLNITINSAANFADTCLNVLEKVETKNSVSLIVMIVFY